MKKCEHGRWRRRCWRCLVVAAAVNNTPIGFLAEHTFWYRVPYVSWIPQVLGIH